jgi:hypothetical protein
MSGHALTSLVSNTNTDIVEKALCPLQEQAKDINISAHEDSG